MEKLQSNLLMPHNQLCIWLFQRGWGNGSLKSRVIEGGNGVPIPSRTSQNPMPSTLVPPITKYLNLISCVDDNGIWDGLQI
ncbi:Stromal cell-derived factor 2-like protein [Bienertia sinuspersici]